MSDTKPDMTLPPLDAKIYRDGEYLDAVTGRGLIVLVLEPDHAGDVVNRWGMDGEQAFRAWLALGRDVADLQPMGYRQAWIRSVVANAHVPDQQQARAHQLAVPTAQTVLDLVGELHGEKAKAALALELRTRLGS